MAISPNGWWLVRQPFFPTRLCHKTLTKSPEEE